MVKLCSLFLLTGLIGGTIGVDFIDQYQGNNAIGDIILKFIDQDSDSNSKINAFKRLFDLMVQYDGMYSVSGTMLGYKVHKLSENVMENDILDHILQNLIPQITQIPWNMTVTIYNIGFKKYLCSSNEKYESGIAYYKVHTFRDLNENCYWILNVKDNGDFFMIQNKASNRYLFAAANDYDMDNDRRRIFTSANVSFVGNWHLEPVRGKNLSYRIKNIFWDEYIYNLNDGRYDEDVISWKPSGCDGSACHWTIRKEPNELPIERKNVLSIYYNMYQGNNAIADFLMIAALNSSTRNLEYRLLYDLMKEHNGLHSTVGMKLDYTIHKMLEENPLDSDLLYINENFRKQWKKLPWDNRIFIQNEKYKKFLCPTSENFQNTTYIIAYTLQDSSPCYWKIEIDPTSNLLRLKSLSTGGYLFAAPNKYNFDIERRRVFISNTNSTETNLSDMQLWYFEHAHQFDSVLRIKNYFWGEFLYNFNDGSLDQDLLTWRPLGCDGTACLWRIIDADTA